MKRERQSLAVQFRRYGNLSLSPGNLPEKNTTIRSPLFRFLLLWTGRKRAMASAARAQSAGGHFHARVEKRAPFLYVLRNEECHTHTHTQEKRRSEAKDGRLLDAAIGLRKKPLRFWLWRAGHVGETTKKRETAFDFNVRVDARSKVLVRPRPRQRKATVCCEFPPLTDRLLFGRRLVPFLSSLLRISSVTTTTTVKCATQVQDEHLLVSCDDNKNPKPAQKRIRKKLKRRRWKATRLRTFRTAAWWHGARKGTQPPVCPSKATRRFGWRSKRTRSATGTYIVNRLKRCFTTILRSYVCQ